jgi:putative ABC transport system permease protein
MWWIPLRSLVRNRRRTLLSVAIIALGTAISFFVYGFLEDSKLQIQASTVKEYGNLQIAAEELFDDTTEGYDYLISPETSVQILDLLQSHDGVMGTTTQLQFPGLLAAGNQTQVVRVTGQIPGNTILNSDNLVVEGRPLEATDVAGVLIGRSSARRLGLTVGDVVTLTLTTVNGAFNATPLQIVGVYRFTSEQVERQVLFMPQAFAQRLLGTDGVDRVIVGLERIQDTGRARRAIKQQLFQLGLTLDVRSWDELSPVYRQLSGFFDLLFGFLTLAVFLLVFFIILQVLTLAFLERTREIGTIRALGTSRTEVFRQLLTESMWLAVLGSLAGVVAGSLCGWAFNALGIQWQPPGTVEASVLSVQITLLTVWPPFLVGVIATVLSAVFPAVQTSGLRVVDALRVE